MHQTTRYQESRYITLLGAVKNALLACLKIMVGITGRSHALLADGIHSLSDLLIDILVLYASRFGSKAADHDHPYGHGRIETAATLALALILLTAGLGIIYNAVLELINTLPLIKPSFYVLVVAVFSIFINEILYFYTLRVAKKIKSRLLVANAWHHRSDSASSVVVLLGVTAAWLGFAKFDACAAIIVGLMIIHMAWQFGLTSLRELVDTGLNDATIVEINELIKKVPGVRALHQLRSRLVGGGIFLDVHIQVSPYISVSEGHFIGQQVHYGLAQTMTDMVDVTVHIDPENDEIEKPIYNLPSRMVLLDLLKQRWAHLPVVNYLDNMVLHYLSGQIAIELHLPLREMPAGLDTVQLTEQLRRALEDYPSIIAVKLLFAL